MKQRVPEGEGDHRNPASGGYTRSDNNKYASHQRPKSVLFESIGEPSDERLQNKRDEIIHHHKERELPYIQVVRDSPKDVDGTGAVDQGVNDPIRRGNYVIVAGFTHVQ